MCNRSFIQNLITRPNYYYEIVTLGKQSHTVQMLDCSSFNVHLDNRNIMDI